MLDSQKVHEPRDCRFANRMLKNVSREWSKCQEVLQGIIGLIGTELCAEAEQLREVSL